MATQKKSTTKSTAPKSSSKKPMSVQDFKKSSKISGILELPSGAVIEVRNTGGMRKFLTGGAIPNSLMGVVQKSIDSGKPLKDEEMNDLIRDKEGGLNDQVIQDMMDMVDSVTVECWVMPPVTPLPEDGEERDPEALYVDEVLEEDKLFVFQWVTGGTKDIEQFRKQHSESLESLAGLEGVEPTSE